WAVFIAPGIIGTVIGVLLSAVPELNQDNIMPKVISLIQTDETWILFILLVALFFSIMSTLDGLMLASAYSFVCDILYRNKTLSELDADPRLANKLLIILRGILLLVTIFGTLGVLYLNQILDVSLFDLTYVMIISQLTLIGPILLGMRGRIGKTSNMPYAIYVSLIIGFGCFFVGKFLDSDFLMTGAGFFTLATSYIVANIVS